MIPEISDEKLALYGDKIDVVKAANKKIFERKITIGDDKPIIEKVPPGGLTFLYLDDRDYYGSNLALFYLEKCKDHRTFSCVWMDITKKKANDLVLIDKVTTYHTFGYYGFFKPSMAEIVAQIPEEYLDRVAAVELCLNRKDEFVYKEDGDPKYHKAVTFLYERPEKNGLLQRLLRR